MGADSSTLWLTLGAALVAGTAAFLGGWYYRGRRAALPSAWLVALVLVGVALAAVLASIALDRATSVSVPLDDRLVPYVDGNGARLCRMLANRMQLTSSRWATGSWVGGFFAALLTAAGGIVGPGGSDANWPRKGAGVLLATVGGLLASSSAFMVARSIAADTAAGYATIAVAAVTEPGSDEDRAAFRACLNVKSQWLQSRADALAQLPPANTAKQAAPDDRMPAAGAGAAE